LRSVMGSIALFGCPPEEYWDYDGRDERVNKRFDVEPPAFCYALGSSFQSVKYVRFDQPQTTTTNLIAMLKKSLSQNLPIIFGFTCFESLYQNQNTGEIPFPSTTEQIIGGHAVCLAGYNDDKTILNSQSGEMTTGAFLFKNSWGTGWGDKGYGWIPYKYFEQKLADDCWTLVTQEWVDHLQFQE
jgi:C1A family cysteine protease